MSTIYDVAAQAGVSLSSVSAVLNNRKNKVGAETKRRILDAVRDLDYRPSRVAQQLATGRSNTIALTFRRQPPQGASYYSISGVLAGAVDAAAAMGMYILISPADPREAFADIVTDLPSHGIDGAVIVGPVIIRDENISAIDNCSVPVVCIDSYPGFRKASTVDIDNYETIRRAVSHFVSLGHTRIAYVGHPPVLQCFADRQRAFFEVMDEYGLSVAGRVINVRLPEEAQDGLLGVFKMEQRPTAVVCDEASFGIDVWEGLTKLGLRVPDDVSLFIFDGLPAEHPGHKLVSHYVLSPYMQGKVATETIRRILLGEVEPPVHLKVSLDLALVP